MNCARFCRARPGAPAVAAANPVSSIYRQVRAALDDQRCAVQPFGLFSRCSSLRVPISSQQMYRRTLMSG